MNISTFYYFKELQHLEKLKHQITVFCLKMQLKGTIIIAHEGINGTISGLKENLNDLHDFFKNLFSIEDFSCKISEDKFHPFKKLKVNIKNEIVALGYKNLDINNRGAYIKASEWDDFIRSEDILLIDTRNDYEVAYGTFENSINPKTQTFKEFPEWCEKNLSNVARDKKIAMFCTGGIRCEKSTSLLKTFGFNNVYHLEGGILKYLETTEGKKWHGSCFVFDERIAVDKNLKAINK